MIIADYQTAGRGHSNRAWHSAPGLNICLSCILYPNIRPQEQFQLSMVVSLAVRDLVTDICPNKPVTIKWPNDIYVGDKKIAGILIQNSIQGNEITSCIAGIGVNVNETAFPPDLPNPTSLKLESTETHHYRKFMYDLLDIHAVRERLSENLSSRLKFLDSHTVQLQNDYHQALYRRGTLSHFRLLQNDLRSGTIEGVDNLGRLLIRWESGEIGSYQHREIDYAIRL
jgi:BirA family biotin operon repressor/biotin-[acetyl-CoA-carboxylase] ligase